MDLSITVSIIISLVITALYCGNVSDERRNMITKENDTSTSRILAAYEPSTDSLDVDLTELNISSSPDLDEESVLVAKKEDTPVNTSFEKKMEHVESTLFVELENKKTS